MALDDSGQKGREFDKSDLFDSIDKTKINSITANRWSSVTVVDYTFAS